MNLTEQFSMLGVTPMEKSKFNDNACYQIFDNLNFNTSGIDLNEPALYFKEI